MGLGPRAVVSTTKYPSSVLTLKLIIAWLSGPAKEVTRLFFAFNSGHPCVERIKAQNVQGKCLSDVRASWQRPSLSKCRRSSVTEVWFSSFQINTPMDLSMIYQHFAYSYYRKGPVNGKISNRRRRTFIFEVGSPGLS